MSSLQCPLLVPIQTSAIDLSITNSAIYCLITFVSVYYIMVISITSRWFSCPKQVSSLRWNALYVYNQFSTWTTRTTNGAYISIVFTVFLYILTANLLGLVPFSFATCQLVVAFGLSLVYFIGVTLIGCWT
jgi:F0F1-type ATP synthase membrane subunit a